MSAGRAQRRIKIPKGEILQAIIRKNLLAEPGHIPEIISGPHTRRNINVEVVDHRDIVVSVLKRLFRAPP